MAKLKSLFGNKKAKDTDGQEEFFRDDFAPVVKVPSKKAAEPKKANNAGAASEQKKVAAKPASVKKAEPKKAASAKKAAEPEKAATAKSNSTAKKSVSAKPAAKSTAKTVAKSTAKATAKTETKSTAKATAKPAVKNTSKTTAKAAAKPVAKASAKPAAKSASKTTAKAAAKPATKSKSTNRDFGDDSDLVKGAVAIKEGKDTANGKWDIRRAKDGRYFFSLYASNHTVIAYSQVYSSTTAVSTGINSVIANAPKAEIEDTTLKKQVSIPCPKWEIYLDKAGEYRFRLYAQNGLIVCHSSHGYATKGGCKGCIESIKRFSADATVDKSYLK